MSDDHKPAPIIDGLEVFEIIVNGDDPRWSKIKPKRYTYCTPFVRVSHFLNQPGERIVRYVLLPCPQDNSNQGVIDDTARRNLTRPDHATTETILDARQAECIEKPITGVCGVVPSDTRRRSFVGCVHERVDGRRLLLVALRHDIWSRRCRFVAVVSEQAFVHLDS